MDSGDRLVVAADILCALQTRISRLELSFLGPHVENPGNQHTEVVVDENTSPHYTHEPNVHYVPARKGQVTTLPQHKGTPIPANTRKLPPHVVQRFVKEFNDYWFLEFHTNINFAFGAEDLNSLTLTDPAMGRNMFLQKFFIESPVILEAFAGVGGDTITFLLKFKPKHLFAVQHGSPLTSHPIEGRAYNLLQLNVNSFLSQYPDIPRNSITFSDETIQNFIAHTPGLTHVDLLYLDPPWVLNGVNECTPEELVDFLNEYVFKALASKKIVPRVICIKTRFGWNEVDRIQHYIPAYYRDHSIKTQPMKNVYYFHIFSLNTPTDVILQRSNAFQKIYNNDGKTKRLRPPEQDDPSIKRVTTDDDRFHARRVEYPDTRPMLPAPAGS